MYRDFYGFTGRPFQLALDPACYFESLSHRRALSCLGYSVAQGEGFVVLTGEVGVGKSALVAQLLATLDRTLRTTAVAICSEADGDAIIPVVARALGLPDHSVAGGQDAIAEFLQEQTECGRRCLLIIDDAHNLSVAALAALRSWSAVQDNGQAVLQVLLVGQPELRNRLKCHPDLEALRQRVIASLLLDPLEAGEVERYVMHRLACVGWNGRPGFAPRVFVEAYAATGGVPARVNQIANRLLLLGAIEQQDHIDEAMLAQVLEEWRGGETIAPAELDLKTTLEVALVRCEGRIAELQRLVVGFGDSGDGSAQAAQCPGHAALLDRLGSLESRVIEQERTIRHTMGILIEWIERDEAQSVAA